MRFQQQSSNRALASRTEIEMRLRTVLWTDLRRNDVQLAVIEMPRNLRGVNWTVSLEHIPAEAIFEAAEIVQEVQSAYELAA